MSIHVDDRQSIVSISRHRGECFELITEYPSYCVVWFAAHRSCHRNRRSPPYDILSAQRYRVETKEHQRRGSLFSGIELRVYERVALLMGVSYLYGFALLPCMLPRLAAEIISLMLTSTPELTFEVNTALIRIEQLRVARARAAFCCCLPLGKAKLQE